MDFFSELANGDIFAILVLIWVVLRVVLGIVEAIGTRNISSVKKTIKELEKMLIIYRLPNYQDQKGFDKSINKQEFSEETPDYVYNEHTGEIEATGQFTNDKEKIQSFRSSSFDELLKKYLDSDIALSACEKQVEPVYGEMPSYDDMAEFAQIIDKADNLRKRYNLPLELSPIEVFDQVSKLADASKKFEDALADNIKKASSKQRNIEEGLQKLDNRPVDPSFEEFLKLYGYKKEDNNEKKKIE